MTDLSVDRMEKNWSYKSLHNISTREIHVQRVQLYQLNKNWDNSISNDNIYVKL